MASLLKPIFSKKGNLVDGTIRGEILLLIRIESFLPFSEFLLGYRNKPGKWTETVLVAPNRGLSATDGDYLTPLTQVYHIALLDPKCVTELL